MTYCKTKYWLVAAALSTAALVGCHDDNNSSGGSTAPSPPAQGTMFSAFVTQVFAYDANSTPVNIDTAVFIFDDDPTAFDGLLM